MPGNVRYLHPVKGRTSTVCANNRVVCCFDSRQHQQLQINHQQCYQKHVRVRCSVDVSCKAHSRLISLLPMFMLSSICLTTTYSLPFDQVVMYSGIIFIIIVWILIVKTLFCDFVCRLEQTFELICLFHCRLSYLEMFSLRQISSTVLVWHINQEDISKATVSTRKYQPKYRLVDISTRDLCNRCCQQQLVNYESEILALFSSAAVFRQKGADRRTKVPTQSLSRMPYPR